MEELATGRNREGVWGQGRVVERNFRRETGNRIGDGIGGPESIQSGEAMKGSWGSRCVNSRGRIRVGGGKVCR